MRQAIEKIMSRVTDECVITGCGYISREVYYVKDRPRNFYNMGAMGSSLGIALGLAYSRKDLRVIVISGDGSTLMSLGTCVLHYHLNPPNLEHYILNNGVYASTGGQPTCFSSLNMGFRNTEGIVVGKESDAPRIPLKCKEIRRRFCENIRIRD